MKGWSADFVAGQEVDFVLNARVVRDDDRAAGSIAEKTNDGGMRAADDAHDAAFGAARARETAEAGDFGDDGVAVHGVFDVVARDEEIAVDVRKRNVRNNEAVAVVMEDETAANFVPGGGFVLGNFLRRSGGSGAALLKSRMLSGLRWGLGGIKRSPLSPQRGSGPNRF